MAPASLIDYRSERKRRLLVIDSYKLHQAATVTSIEIARHKCNADVVIIPGGCTSIVQPMDRCINKPFKEAMRVSWEEWMHQDRPKTLMGNLKQPTRQNIINWVSKAWDSNKTTNSSKTLWFIHFLSVAYPMLWMVPKTTLPLTMYLPSK